MGFIISLLQGKSQFWAYQLLERNDILLQFMSTFFDAMASLNEDPQRTSTAEAALHVLQQGRRMAEDYVMDFRRWSADTQWNDVAL